MGLFVCALVIVSASFAAAGVPDPANTVVQMAYTGTEDVVLYVLPNGFGSSFTEAQIKGGGANVDATITMTVRDGNDVAVASFPAEDMWLESGDNGLVPCEGGNTADVNTDADGNTYWTAALAAGGSSEAACYVFLNGVALTLQALPLSFNSADMNGDGAVDLVDVGSFASAFFGGAYDFTADFISDGVIDLLDLNRLSSSSGATCN